MPQSLVQIYLHIVFSTKDRRPFLTDQSLRTKLHAYLAGTCNALKCPAIIVGGVEDHVHILCRFGKTIDVAVLIRESSKWVKDQDRKLFDFHWQSGYGAFSVSPSHVPKLKTYISEQEEHHKQVSFQDEFRGHCQKYGVEIDERYVWD